MKKLALVAAFALLAGTAQAQTFQARDLTGDGVTDAFYDSTHNLTWLADANLYATQGGPADRDPWGVDGATLPAGQVRLTTALSWVDQLVIGSVTDWRLPQRVIPDGFEPSPWCPIECVRVTPQASQLPSELSFLAGVTGQFSNFMNGYYLSWTPDMVWQEMRNVVTGATVSTDETGWMTGYVLAVRSGDAGSPTSTVAAPVPEPQTYALMIAALGALAIARRRKSLRR
ncbi:MAG TPA: PEP-CTERM sorting domain-containing protein [Rhizobacter sp.]